jgi:hypothetical protein
MGFIWVESIVEDLPMHLRIYSRLAQLLIEYIPEAEYQPYVAGNGFADALASHVETSSPQILIRMKTYTLPQASYQP